MQVQDAFHANPAAGRAVAEGSSQTEVKAWRRSTSASHASGLYEMATEICDEHIRDASSGVFSHFGPNDVNGPVRDHRNCMDLQAPTAIACLREAGKEQSPLRKSDPNLPSSF